MARDQRRPESLAPAARLSMRLGEVARLAARADERPEDERLQRRLAQRSTSTAAAHDRRRDQRRRRRPRAVLLGEMWGRNVRRPKRRPDEVGTGVEGPDGRTSEQEPGPRRRRRAERRRAGSGRTRPRRERTQGAEQAHVERPEHRGRPGREARRRVAPGERGDRGRDHDAPAAIPRRARQRRDVGPPSRASRRQRRRGDQDRGPDDDAAGDAGTSGGGSSRARLPRRRARPATSDQRADADGRPAASATTTTGTMTSALRRPLRSTVDRVSARTGAPRRAYSSSAASKAVGVEVGPERRTEVELRVGGLPDQEVARGAARRRCGSRGPGRAGRPCRGAPRSAPRRSRPAGSAGRHDAPGPRRRSRSGRRS